MKKSGLLALVVVLLVLTSCEQPGSTTTGIPLLPIIGINDSGSNARALYGESDSATEMSFTLMSPVLLGFSGNSLNIGHGSSLTYEVLGETLTLTVGYDASLKIATLNGTLSDGVSYVNLSMDYDSMTFDYEQYILIEDDPADPATTLPLGGGVAIVYYNYVDVPFSANGEFHTYQEGYSLQPGNVSVIETDIVFGTYDNKKIGGTYVHKFKSDNTQPDLSGITDFKTLTKTEVLSYFDDEATWTGADHSFGYYIFKDISAKQLYADSLLAAAFGDVIASSSCPWTPLP